MEHNDLLMKTIDNIDRKVDGLVIDIQGVRQDLVRNEEWHKVLNSQVKDIHDAVYGNGKIGLSQEIKCIDDAVGANAEEIGNLIEKVDELSKRHQKQDSLKEASKLEWLRGWRAVIFAVVTTALTAVATLGVDRFLDNLLAHIEP